MTESFLTTHPHIRRIVYGACVLVVLAALGSMFGWDRVAGWAESGARTFGIEIGATITKGDRR